MRLALVVPAVTAALALSLASCSSGSVPTADSSPPPSASISGSPSPQSRTDSTALATMVSAVIAGRDWTWSEQGNAVATTDVQMYSGPSHCDWDEIIFLSIGWPLGTSIDASDSADTIRQFVRDPSGTGAITNVSAGSFEPTATLPADASYSGYHTAEVQLWLTKSDPDSAYVTDGTTTERWPRATRPVACA